MFRSNTRYDGSTVYADLRVARTVKTVLDIADYEGEIEELELSAPLGSNVLPSCNSALSNDATYLTRETLSTSKELRASADNGFVHVVRIATTGDNKVRVIARCEQAAAE